MTRVFEYMDCAERGLTVGETAARLGVSRQAVFIAVKRHGIAFRKESDVKAQTVRAPIPKNIHALVAALADKRGAAFDVVLADLVTAGARASL